MCVGGGDCVCVCVCVEGGAVFCSVLFLQFHVEFSLFINVKMRTAL